MVDDPFIKDPNGESTLDDKAETSLSSPDEIARPSAPNVNEVTADDPTDTPRRVLHTGDTELDVGVGDTRGAEDDGVVVGEDGSAVPCWFASADELE